jgi:hypothetical protein
VASERVVGGQHLIVVDRHHPAWRYPAAAAEFTSRIDGQQPAVLAAATAMTRTRTTLSTVIGAIDAIKVIAVLSTVRLSRRRDA